MSRSRVLVVGAGVIGLSCAVRLLEAGHEVDVIARDLPLETTSAVSAAIWYPYLSAPAEKIAAWGARAFARYAEMAEQGVPAVRMGTGTKLLRAPAPRPAWAGGVPGFTVTDAVPEPYVSGWRLTVPVVEMSRYLPWLHERVERLGGTVTRAALAHLPEPDGGVVVNACGLGAIGLARDRTMTPIRGQVVRVEQFGAREWWTDDEIVSYLVPRSRDIILGGTAEMEEWSRVPDPQVTRRIVEDAAAVVPEHAGAIRSARILGVRAGLRPGRPMVRLSRSGAGRRADRALLRARRLGYDAGVGLRRGGRRPGRRRVAEWGGAPLPRRRHRSAHPQARGGRPDHHPAHARPRGRPRGR